MQQQKSNPYNSNRISKEKQTLRSSMHQTAKHVEKEKQLLQQQRIADERKEEEQRDNHKRREERLNAMFDKIESRKVPTTTGMNRTLKPIIENEFEQTDTKQPSLNSSAYIDPAGVNNNNNKLSSQVELQKLNLQIEQHQKKVATYENKLENDLSQTQQALIQEMRDHGLLANLSSNQDPDNLVLNKLMKPLEQHLQQSFDRMKEDINSLAHNKNYFAMSLKMFFVELGTNNQDLLELMCHNYIHSWVNKDIARKQRQESKYQVEEKMEYLRLQKDKLNKDIKEYEAMNGSFNGPQILQERRLLDRYEMTPNETRKRTSSALNKSISNPNINNSFFGSVGGEPPRYMSATYSGLAKQDERKKHENLNKTVVAQSSQPAWKPNSNIDYTLEKDHIKKLHNPKQIRQSKDNIFDERDLRFMQNKAGRRSVSAMRMGDQNDLEWGQSTRKLGNKMGVYMLDGNVQVVSEKSDEGGDKELELAEKKEKVAQVTERLHNENKRKKEQQLKLQQRYASEDTKECTFQPKTYQTNIAGQRKFPATPRRQLQEPTPSLSAIRRQKEAVREGAKEHPPYENSDRAKSIHNKTPDKQSGNEDEENVPAEPQQNPNQLFDYLSKTHIDSKKKLQFLAEQKQRIEMATCTFKPAINSARGSRTNSLQGIQRIEKLAKNQQKTFRTNNVTSQMKELQKCTFKPTFNKKSMKMVQSGSNCDSLYKKFVEKKEKKEQLKHQRELKDFTFKPQIKVLKNITAPKRIQSKLNMYSNARKSRIVDQQQQELKWRTQSLATLPELGNGLETPPQPADKAHRRVQNKSMVVVNDADDDEDIERAAEDANHNKYIQGYIQGQKDKQEREHVQQLNKKDQLFGAAAKKERDDKTLERNPFLYGGAQANGAIDIKNFIEKSKQPSKYYQEHKSSIVSLTSQNNSGQKTADNDQPDLLPKPSKDASRNDSAIHRREVRELTNALLGQTDKIINFNTQGTKK